MIPNEKGCKGLVTCIHVEGENSFLLLTSMMKWAYRVLIADVYILDSNLNVPDHISNQLLHKPRILVSLLI